MLLRTPDIIKVYQKLCRVHGFWPYNYHFSFFVYLSFLESIYSFLEALVRLLIGLLLCKKLSQNLSKAKFNTSKQ